MADLWNARDYEDLRKLMRPDYTYTASDGTESAGPEVSLAVAKTYGDVFLDANMQLKRLYTDEQAAIAEGAVEGTHTGKLVGIARAANACDAYCAMSLSARQQNLSGTRLLRSIDHSHSDWCDSSDGGRYVVVCSPLATAHPVEPGGKADLIDCMRTRPVSCYS